MAEISKQALKVENNTSFPNNNTGAITPSDLRAFNVDMIDSLVDELGYNVDSASWNQSIDALEAFTSSQQPSFNALNQFTASQLVINSGVNAFTQSADARLDALESETQNLELFTASVNQIADNGIVQGTSTRLHFYGLVSASIVPNVNGAIASINIEQDGTKLNSASFNSYTASTDSDLDSIHQTTQSLNNFTASLTTAFVGTASFNAYTQSINSYTSSNDAKVNSLINATASYATSAITASSLVTASVNLNTITFTKGDASTFNITVNTGSGGGGTTDITSLNAFTASQDTKNTTLANVTASLNASTASQQSQIDNLIAATGSYITTPLTSLNQFTQSQDTKNSTLATYTASVDTKFSTLGTQSGSWITESETASFARTNVDNNFTANQTFTNITAVSASFTYVQTTYETSSVIYSSGSNQFGDAADDVQTLYGSVRVVNELTASGLNYPNADNGAKAFMQTDGAGNLSLQYVDAIFETVRNMSGVALDKGTPVYISGSTGDNGNAYVADASDTAKMPAVYILGEDLAIGATGIALVGGLIEGVDTTGYPAGTIIYVAEGGGWSDVRPSGSASIVQVLGVVQKEGVGGQGVVINQLEATLPNIQTGYAWVGNGSNQPVQVATSSFIDAIPLTSLNSFTQSQDTKNTTLENVTSSLQSYTASQASLNATFATTGSNSFDGNQIISGGLTLSGSFGITYVEGGAEVIQQVTALGNYQTLYDGGMLFQTDGVNNYEQTIPTTFSKGVTINSGSAFNDGVTITGGLTGSLQQGYAWVGNVAGVSVPVPTSSFAGGGGTISVQDEGTILGNATSFDFNGAGVTATLTAGTASITIPGGGGSIDTGSFATTGSNTFRGTQTIITGNDKATFAVDNGVAIGPTNGTGGNAIGAINLSGYSGSLVLTNNSYTNTTSSLTHLVASDNTLLANFIFRANANTGTTQISGSGNIFTNPGTPTTGRVNYIGGNTNLFLNGQSQQLPQITGSAASVSGNRPTMNANYIAGTQAWTINQAVNTGTHTYSNNILAGTGTWTFNMLGNTGTVTVSNNTGLSSTMTLNSPSRSIAQINEGASGSNALTIQNNSIAGTLTYNGPVSSSTHTIQQNAILGTVTLNAQSSSRALTVSSNYINGVVTYNDNTVFAPTLGGSNGLTNTNINGTFTINNRASSSVNIANNNVNTWTLSNDHDASSITLAGTRFLGVNGNALFGVLSNNLYASGSNGATNTNRAFVNNLFAGQFISASVVGDGTSTSMQGTIGAGNGLNVVGTTLRDASNSSGAGGTIGSAFFGRYNKEGLGFNTTAEVILAVGTGTSGSTGITRKTGFLIDSGSNTFVEGTFNVSGSSSYTGSVYGNVVSMSVTSNTASMDLNLGNYFELTSSASPLRIELSNIKGGQTATLILSASVSSSIAFSSNVGQPSPGAYSGSAVASIDILSFVAFNNSRANLVATKNIV